MNIVIIASAGRCGIHEYSLVLSEGFQENGHQVRYIGVKNHNNADLLHQIHQIRSEDDIVIFEYEPGIFWLGGIIRAMAWLRFYRRKRIILSIHEISPEKFPEARQIQWHLARQISSRGYFGEIFKLILASGDVLLRFITLRLGWLAMGWLPHTILVHSSKGKENIRLINSDNGKIYYAPLLVKQLDTHTDKFRHKLHVPKDTFVFIIPGFLFRRKRITQVIEQLPSHSELWIVGTESAYDPDYLKEIKVAVAQLEHPNQVRIIQDYERMEEYLQAADVAILYYADGYQSAVASLAVGAGKPCIFSNIPAFADLRDAGLTVNTPMELNKAMKQIQDHIVYEELRDKALRLRQYLSPGAIAKQYLQNV